MLLLVLLVPVVVSCGECSCMVIDGSDWQDVCACFSVLSWRMLLSTGRSGRDSMQRESPAGSDHALRPIAKHSSEARQVATLTLTRSIATAAV